jgi:hypothetical protein
VKSSCLCRSVPTQSLFGLSLDWQLMPAFTLRVESPSRFRQSENQKCWWQLSGEGNEENKSPHSWLAPVSHSLAPKRSLVLGNRNGKTSPNQTIKQPRTSGTIEVTRKNRENA